MNWPSPDGLEWFPFDSLCVKCIHIPGGMPLSKIIVVSCQCVAVAVKNTAASDSVCVSICVRGWEKFCPDLLVVLVPLSSPTRAVFSPPQWATFPAANCHRNCIHLSFHSVHLLPVSYPISQYSQYVTLVFQFNWMFEMSWQFSDEWKLENVFLHDRRLKGIERLTAKPTETNFRWI